MMDLKKKKYEQYCTSFDPVHAQDVLCQKRGLPPIVDFFPYHANFKKYKHIEKL